MSKWLVGSSSMMMSGLDRSSLPKETRVFWPPERVEISFVKSSSAKPRPFKTPVISLW